MNFHQSDDNHTMSTDKPKTPAKSSAASKNRSQKRANKKQTDKLKDAAIKKARASSNGAQTINPELKNTLIEKALSKHIDLSTAKVKTQRDGSTKYTLDASDEVIAKPKDAPKVTREQYLEYFYRARELVMTEENYADGADILKQLIRINPKDVGVLKLLAIVSEKIRNYPATIEFFKQALTITPDDPSVLASLGTMQIRTGQVDEGLNNLLYVINNHSDYEHFTTKMLSDIHNTISTTYLEIGEKEKAIEHNVKACDLDMDNHRPLYNLATQVMYIKDKDSKYFKRLKEMESNEITETDHDKNTHIFYSLFDVYDGLKEYETAFDYMLKGAEEKRKLISKSVQPAASIDYNYNYIKKFFDADFFKTYSLGGYATDKPIFVLGMPRSGTTLLEQILLSHPDIEGIGEDPLMGHLMRTYSYLEPNKGIRYPLRSSNQKQYIAPDKIGENYGNYIDKLHPKARRVINKSIGNFLFIGYVSQALPDARFIHIKRNAMDACISTLSKNFIDDAQSYSYNLEEMGMYYRKYVELMDHWNEFLSERIITVTYEDLVDDLESNARKIIDFLDLPWDNACLEFYKSKSTVRTASVTQVRKPIYSSSVGRWKRYGPKVIPLIKALGHAAPPEAIEYLKEHEVEEA